MMRSFLLVFVIALILVSGCPALEDSTPTSTQSPTELPSTETELAQTEVTRLIWSLEIAVADVPREEGAVLEGSVRTQGHFDGRVYGIAVQFLTEDEEVIKEIPVGNISTLGGEAEFNTTIPAIPVYVVAKAEGWDTGGVTFSGSHGLKITEDQVSSYAISDPENFTR